MVSATILTSFIEEANVTITKVEVRNDSDSSGNPFMVLLEDTLRYNLLDLRNGITAELLETEIPVGEYSLIRLYVDHASIKVKDHDTYDVKVPSGASTGIKIFIKPALQVAGIKGFNFKPVIRAVNHTTSGDVEGFVMDADSLNLADAEVWIFSDSIISTAYSSEDGFYGLPGIPSGTYSMSATKAGFDTATVNDLTVTGGNLTQQNFTLHPVQE